MATLVEKKESSEEEGGGSEGEEKEVEDEGEELADKEEGEGAVNGTHPEQVGKIYILVYCLLACKKFGFIKL